MRIGFLGPKTTFSHIAALKMFSGQELLGADEAFLTGTAAEIVGIAFIDKKPVGNGQTGPITKKLKEKFSEIVHGKNLEYKNWLSFLK